MTNGGSPVKPGGLTHLKNVARFLTLVETIRGRGQNMPGMGVFSGYSGYGKSCSTSFAMHHPIRARVVEVKDSWTRKKFLFKILEEALGPKAASEFARLTVPDLAEQVIFVLSEDTQRPLIIDEADKLADKNMLELVRELYEASKAPIILVGEELLPAKIERFERVHGRVREWVLAEACDVQDARMLADVYCPSLDIRDCLLDKLVEVTGGGARRIAVNLDRIREQSLSKPTSTFSAESFADNWFYTGKYPRRKQQEAA